MSNLFAMMYTGVSGIMAAQVGMSVVGHNQANMNVDGYSKQIVNFATASPQMTRYGSIGKGVDVINIERVHDELLTKTVRNENSSYNYFSSMQSNLKKAMLYFNELESGSGLGDPLKEYFDAWQDLASTSPDDTDEGSIKRYALIEKAATLSQKLREGYASIINVQNDIDTKITRDVASINSMLLSIGELNQSIASEEASGKPANDLRDSRDRLLRKISAMASVTSYEKDNGEIVLSIGSQVVVDGNSVHKLEALRNPEKGGKIDVYFTTNDPNYIPVNISDNLISGSISGDIKTRDVMLNKYLDELDLLATSIIQETNQIHVLGQGLTRFNQISGTNGVLQSDFILGSLTGELALPVKKGTFTIDIYDSAGAVTDTLEFIVDPATDTFESVIRTINLNSNGKLTAILSENNTIEIISSPNTTFAFTSDSSNFLVAAGLNSFFTGTSAADINISGFLSNNPEYIATGTTGAPGDNSIAKLISEIQNKKIDDGSGPNIGEFYGIFIGMMASDKAQVDVFASTKEMSYNQVALRLESITGVSESEELVNMQTFQRTFEANSRFINVVDEMLNTIINGLGTGGR